MRSSSNLMINPGAENGEKEFGRNEVFRRKSMDSSGDLRVFALPTVAPPSKGKGRNCASGTVCGNGVIKYACRHSVLSYVSFAIVLHVVLRRCTSERERRKFLTARQHENGRERYTNSLIPSSVPIEPNITLITTGFSGYSSARQKELHLVAFRNVNLGLERYHRLCEPQCMPVYSTSTKCSFRNVEQKVTYRDLFQEANKFIGSTVVIANADIYLDHSIYCASMVDKNTVLALSRHPSPDCITSGRGASGREPVDFCGGYHPRHAASHDGFVLTPPVPQPVLDGLAGLAVNELGAENVVIHLMQTAGFNVVNPCERIHLFHQHCGNERAASARKGIASAKWRKLFGATTEWGYGGKSWIREELRRRFGTVDCVALGVMVERKKRLPQRAF